VTAVAAHCPPTSLADDLAAVCRAIDQQDGPVSEAVAFGWSDSSFRGDDCSLWKRR
jgi:hypothetical protein